MLCKLCSVGESWPVRPPGGERSAEPPGKAGPQGRAVLRRESAMTNRVGPDCSTLVRNLEKRRVTHRIGVVTPEP